MPLPLQLHLRSGNRTQHFLLQRSLRYRLLLHNRIQHSVPLPQNIRSPAQGITVRNTELRNHRSEWKPSLNRLCPLLLPPLSPQPLSPLRLSLPLRSLLLLRLLCLRSQSCILRSMDTAIAAVSTVARIFFFMILSFSFYKYIGSLSYRNCISGIYNFPRHFGPGHYLYFI